MPRGGLIYSPGENLRAVEARTCVACEKEFQPKPGGYSALYCSKSCKSRIKYKREKGTESKLRQERRTRELRQIRFKEDGGFLEKHRSSNRKSIRNVRQWLAAYKSSIGCVDCGYNVHPSALQLDHEGVKSVEIAHARSSVSRLQAEIKNGNCKVRCANCHSIKTWQSKQPPPIEAFVFPHKIFHVRCEPTVFDVSLRQEESVTQMTKHARVGPSSLTRVSECPASVREYEGLPRSSSIYSAEGTLYHEIASDCLEWGLDPHVYDGKVMSADGFTFTVDTEITDAMIPALDWLNQQPGKLFIETRVSLEPWMPGQFGTLDVGLWDEETRTATIFDWKFGAGVPVFALNNKQLRAYAIGFFETILKPMGVIPLRWRIIIEQPRCRGGSNFGQPWEISHDELMEFGPEMSRIFEDAQDPNAPFKAGDHCQFCDVKKRKQGCGAYDEWMLESAGMMFDALDEAVVSGEPIKLQAHGLITPERRSAIVKSMGEVKKWLDRLHANTLDDALAGLPTPGLKAVSGRMGDRYWGDAAKAEKLIVSVLAEDAFTKKLKSVKQVEDVVAPTKRRLGHPETWDQLKRLIAQDEGKPALVSLDDERPPLKTVDQMFDD